MYSAEAESRVSTRVVGSLEVLLTNKFLCKDSHPHMDMQNTRTSVRTTSVRPMTSGTSTASMTWMSSCVCTKGIMSLDFDDM